jgi:hypothetical protein
LPNVVTLNGTEYRLCLLDTNAISEMVKRRESLGRFLAWSLESRTHYIPCFTVFTVLELRRKPGLYELFLERFGPLASMLLKGHEELLEEETRAYPDPSDIDPAEKRSRLAGRFETFTAHRV